MGLESVALQPKNENNFPDLNIDVQKVIDELAQEKRQVISKEDAVSLVSQLNDSLIQSSLFRKDKDSAKVSCTPEALQLLDDTLKNIIDRIKQETNVEEELQGIVELDGLVNFREYASKMPRVKLKNKRNSRVGGEYSFVFDRVKVNSSLEADNPFNVISALVVKGSVRDFVVLFHELIHSKQRNKRKNIFRQLEVLSINIAAGVNLAVELPAIFSYGVMASSLLVAWKAYKVKKDESPLQEMHAYQAANQTLDGEDHFSTSISIAEQLRSGYKLKSKKDMDRIITAAQQLSQLKTLGSSHEEIGQLIQTAKWDNKKVQYDTLQSALDLKKNEQGLDDEDLDTLADINRIKRKTRVLRIQRIAQEEVKRTLGIIENFKEV